MISSLSQLRAKGRADLSGRWNEAAMFTFVYLIVMGFVSALGSGLDSLVLGPRTLAFTSDISYVNAVSESLSSVFGIILTVLALPIGWGILCIFTLGIGYFWLAPYIDQTMANFYEEVKADYEGRKGE